MTMQFSNMATKCLPADIPLAHKNFLPSLSLPVKPRSNRARCPRVDGREQVDDDDDDDDDNNNYKLYQLMRGIVPYAIGLYWGHLHSNNRFKGRSLTDFCVRSREPVTK